ncbi:hypothetical protein HBE96_05860 [Clostridium sp. P21]|uniref:RiboL-PSP-HEPN domain-containing protein n=1 Tax=Clostridium muellerianum TaxID=2716538 RepID=A0A7Y0EFL2_9CLOT|nr:HEPN domain-containing protein [Clostridium muellerianum]NMM62217.1 hypothetical protein [Clostridium muellerianum]
MNVKEEIFNVTKSELERIYMTKVNTNLILLRGSYANKEDIINKLKKDPITIINQIIPHIVTEELKFSTSIESNDDVREDHPINIYDILHINHFSLITDVSDITYVFEDYLGNITEGSYYGIDAYMDYFNNYSGKISIKGTYTRPGFQPELTLMDIDSALKTKVKLSVTGLANEVNTPSWVYYLVEGCINYVNNNYRMALFNIFASLDNFIEDMIREILDYYLMNYKRFLDTYVDDNKAYLEAKIYLQDKIKNCSRDNRRLVEKLKDIMSEVNIKGNNPSFQQLCNIYKIEFKKIETYRNKVAHGEPCDEEPNFGESLYYILTIILSILNVFDFEKDQWQNIIR